ncbi:MAG: T9SS type A sorting domain-containing protein [Bacteroidales bacterium]
MKNQTLSFILCLATCFIHFNIYSQITRGAQPGEIYFSGHWYIDNNGQVHYGIFRSADNGEHISLQYENIEVPPPDEMKIGKVLGDAADGALYNYGWNELWVSFDSGDNWTYREDYPDYTKYFTGSIQGLIFRGNYQGFFKSIDFASTFDLLPITVICPFTEIGFSEPEFYGVYGEPGLYYNFVHTIDYGQTCTEIPIDSTTAFWSVSGYSPQISRGTNPGEIYLVSWWPDYHYKIFHSVDTGYTWTEKFESGYIDIFYWGVTYTAGRQPGSFYVKRATPAPSGDHTWLYIDYSSDYGETFTTYFHDLDSTITGLDIHERNTIHLSNYPNPFKDFTTFSFQLPANCKNAQLNIYDLPGKIIRVFDIIGQRNQVWSGKDNSGKQVREGIYLYNISYDNYISQFNKLVIIN